MNVNEKLQELRKLMKKYGLDAYVIPSSDPHMSEYVPEHWKGRSWFSGFTGSAGTVAVTMDESGLWTDGRYFIQAEKQLDDSEIKLFKMNIPGFPTCLEWLESKLDNGQNVGYCGSLLSVSEYKEMKDRFSIKGIGIIKEYDLIGELWKKRPELPSSPVFIHGIPYTGLSAGEKINKVREEMQKTGADHYLLNSLDDIAWLLNIRGSDVPFVPVAVCNVLVSPDKAYLFIDTAKITNEVKENLNENGIEIYGYPDIDMKLASLNSKACIAFDPKRTNCRLYGSINPECRKVEIDEITARLKAVKNEKELENIKNAHIKDGAAMVKFLFWLDRNLGTTEISELTVEEKLEFFRKQQEHYLGPSFTPIVGYREHGAMMHYRATEESCCVFERKGLVVIDSGGQYLDGTTDITRTVILGEISEEEKRDFTLVLKAHISLAQAKFLYGTTGSNLDILARQPLWKEGIDYKCGTGHGIGYLLSVHEGPHRISPIPNNVKLEKGMLVSDEPGVYKEGRYGIRTENILLVAEDEKTDSGQFLKFEVISYCPVDLKGIDAGLLSGSEKSWLNNYHRMVREMLSPYLAEEEKVWLAENTKPL